MTECREDILWFYEKKIIVLKISKENLLNDWMLRGHFQIWQKKKAKPEMASVIWNDMANNNVKKPLKNQN